MTPDEKKKQFEENIVKLAVQEYYKYVDGKGIERSEEDCAMFYDVYRMGIFAGINYATDQYVKSMEKFEQQKQGNERTNGIKETNLTNKGEKNE